MNQIKHIFFDLDHTLWDFEANAQLTLQEIFEEFNLASEINTDVQSFCNAFLAVNYEMWKLFDDRKINKQQLREQRGPKVLEKFEVINPELAETIESTYLKRCPTKGQVFPHTFEVLEYLSKKYTLHILTNGFQSSQKIKIDYANLRPYFREVITSECSPYKKPDLAYYEFALQKIKTTSTKVIMIGDNLRNDILPPRELGIKAIHFDPKNSFSQDSINSLHQLFELL
ncbi:MAG: HAD-IA family hydrolase [Cytophagales bacterium]|nr:HAD-IA family hydrolase [Cytophagales bacterium]